MRVATRSAASWGLIAALLVSVVFAPSIGRSLWAATLHNLAHGPIFGGVAVLALFGLRGTNWFVRLRLVYQYPIAFAIAAALGAATELVQLSTGRDASWFDLGNDLLGAVAFLAVAAAFDRAAQRRRIGAIVVALGVALAALAALIQPLLETADAYRRRAEAFPVIADYSRGVGFEFLHARLSNIDVVALPPKFAALTGERALRIEFLPGSWPGIEIKEAPPDWRGYRAVLLDVTNPQAREIELVVRIDDAAHNGRFADRFNRKFNVPAATRAVLRIPLSDIEAAPRERTFDLGNVARIFVFQSTVSSPETIYCSGMWLQ